MPKLQTYKAEHNGILPDKLCDLPEVTHLLNDAWGHSIQYSNERGRWFLKSLGKKGVDEEFDMSSHIPMFTPTPQNIVYYEGMSQLREKLFGQGEIQIGKVRIWLKNNSVQFSFPTVEDNDVQ